MSGEEFSHSHITSIGVDKSYCKRIVRDTEIEVTAWDTVGQEKYRSVPKMLYRDAQCILLIYDITDWSTFEKINSWIEDIRENTSAAKTPIILVGNKLDLITTIGRNVNKEDGKELADKYDLSFFEVSAKDLDNIEEMFDELIKQAYDFAVKLGGNSETLRISRRRSQEKNKNKNRK